MSLVALKRKSNRYFKPVSKNGFSLNGVYRNQGRVGQTSLGRSVTRTPYKGALPVGNGGCCGNYVVSVAKSGTLCNNDTSVVKRSNMNTSGLVKSRYIYPTSVFNSLCEDGGCNIAKPVVKDFSPLNFSQGFHIKHVRDFVARCNSDGWQPNAGIWNCDGNCRAGSNFIGTKKVIYEAYTKDLNIKSSSEYQTTQLIKNKCVSNNN